MQESAKRKMALCECICFASYLLMDSRNVRVVLGDLGAAVGGFRDAGVGRCLGIGLLSKSSTTLCSAETPNIANVSDETDDLDISSDMLAD